MRNWPKLLPMLTLAVSIGAVLLLAAFLGAVTIEYTIAYFGYFFAAIIVGTAGWLIVRLLDWKAIVSGWNRQKLLRVGFLAAVSLGSATLEPCRVKIVWDEPLMGLTAASMHFDRLCVVPGSGNASAGDYTYLQGSPDKRPALFPFLVSVLHDLTGYRPFNGILLNLLFIPVFWWLVFWLGLRLRGEDADGYLATLLLFSVPFLHGLATSAGFDFFNALLILHVLAWAIKWHEHPDDQRYATVFAVSLWLLANNRYEGPLWIAPFGAFALWNWWRRRKILLTLPMALSPLALLPAVLTYQLQDKVNIYWQEGFNGRTTTFSSSFFTENVREAIHFAANLGPNAMGSFLLTVLGVGTVLALALARFVEPKKPSSVIEPPKPVLAAPWWFFFGGCFLYFAVLMMFNWGVFSAYMTTRLSLPLHLPVPFAIVSVVRRKPRAFAYGAALAALGIMAFSASQWNESFFFSRGLHFLLITFAAVTVAGLLHLRGQLSVRWLYILVCGYIVGSTIPRAQTHEYLDHYAAYRYFEATDQFVADHEGENSIFISAFAHAALLRREAAGSPKLLNENPDLFRMRMEEQHAYAHVYFLDLQQYDKDTGEWSPIAGRINPELYDLDLIETRHVASWVEMKVFEVSAKAPSAPLPDSTPTPAEHATP